MQEEQHIKDVLYRYLSGEASEKEITLVENWLKGEGNEVELDRMKKQLERFGAYRGNPAQVDTEEAWKKVSLRLNLSKTEKEVKVIPLFSRISTP